MAQDRADPAGAAWRTGAAGGVGFAAPVLVAWLLAALPGIVFHRVIDPGTLLIGTDDAMRLVQVRDLMAGQGWFDLTQHRLGIGGVEMHWSRLVDAPIAGLILLLRPALGAAAAETAAVYAWPLVLLGPALAAAAAAGRALAGPAGLWLVSLLTALHLSQVGRFVPGQIDHHNVQLTLLVVALSLAAVATRRSRAAIGAGAAIAASLAVGIELLPVIAVLGLCAGLGWVADGGAGRERIVGLAAGFAATLVLLFLAAAPASAWRGGFCDALGRDLALPALTGAAVLGLWAALRPPASPAGRLGALALAGAAAAAVALGVAPACLSDPLAGLDPFLRTEWLDRVAEARGWATTLRTSPWTEGPILLATLLAVAACAALLRSHPAERWLWAMFGGAIVLALGLAFVQQRVAAALPPLAALPVAILGVRLYRAARGGGSLLGALGAVAIVAAGSPTVWAFVRPAEAPVSGPPAALDGAPPPPTMVDLWDCYRPEELAPLAALPPGLVSASSNLGAHVLLSGPHRVLAAPYHRNTAGMEAQLRIAFASDAEAGRRLRALGVAYVVTCTQDGEYRGARRDGFGFRLARGEVPAFLEPVASGPGGVIAVYALKPAP